MFEGFSKLKKILAVFGTRPEAIKMCPLVKVLSKNKKVDLRVCVTGQHRQMLDQVLNIFEVKPDYDLDVMKPNQTLSKITVEILTKIENVLLEFKPDIILVHGDTTTSFAASLAAYYMKIKIGHIEAGLRTGDIYSPWPEEGNRKLTGALANFHFSPTKEARQNLINEGIKSSKIFVTGNTVIDSLLFTKEKIEGDSKLIHEIKKNFPFLREEARLILITGHRRENFGGGFKSICNAILKLAKKNQDIDFIYPVHLNPNVNDLVRARLSDISNVHLTNPLDYLPFVYLMDRSELILTDSGGIQEEAPSLSKPVLVMREVTERPEAVKAGTVKLVGTSEKKIITEVGKIISNKSVRKKIKNPYGDGKSSEKISKILTKILNT